ncbi:hypothetical protein CHS0354_037051 [Potamilus streckersoni]|uniref:Ras-associating domain-containing protein n=1 Tax=Potamilus streckersoni TaxID=2493646 RepID=A0AAE0SKB0_9BIVA|nr:hypothetical protein CHS0354_037051 [Potamilus streckersoni]
MDKTTRQMNKTTRQDMQTISILVDGKNCYQKVTKNTTCGDVIQHLLKDSDMNLKNKDSYYLSASNNITEQKLSKKIKVLKVAEDLAFGTNRLHFILRKKTRLRVPDVSAKIQRRLGEKSSAKELKSEKVEPMHYAPVQAPKEIRGVKRLCQFVQVQKRHLNKSNDTTKFTKQSMEQKTSFPNKSKENINLDQVPNNVIDENMKGSFSLCDTVTTKKTENLSSAFPRSWSVDRSIIDDHMTLKCKFDRKYVDHANDSLDEKLNTIINEIRHCTFNTAEDVANDIMIVEDDTYHEDEDPGSFVKMSDPFRQRVTSANPRRIRENEEPIPSCLLENKTMNYLLRSRKRTPMMRQIEAMQLAFDKLTNLELQEITPCDSYLSRGTDGALSELISQRKPTFSREKEGCKHFCQHGYVLKSEENVHYAVLDKERDEVIDSTSDVGINSSNHFASSLHDITGNIQSNDRDHSVLTFDESSRVMSYVQDSQYANDCLSVQTLKMKLVDYSLSDSDISSVAGESA